MNGIIELYLHQYSSATTPDFKSMLMQGFMICLWYDLGQTVTVLEQHGKMEEILFCVFGLVQDGSIKADFEVKKLMLGLTSFLVASEMPDSIRNNYSNIMKALAWLSSKSIEIRQKAIQGE